MRRISVTLFVFVFAVVFTAGGVVAGLHPMYRQFSGWWQATSYVPVSAHVVSAELESHPGRKGTAYRALAEFSYEYQGRSYLSHGVNLSAGGGDNIGTYQQDTYERLKQARDYSMPVTLWVNPRQPGQAVYDRTIRWTLMIALIPFAVLFPAVGVGACWLIWRLWRTREVLDPLAVALGASQPTPSTPGSLMIQADRGKLHTLLTVAVFWNILCWSIAIPFFTSAKAVPEALALVSVFLVIGLMLIAMIWVPMRTQWRIGKPVLAISERGVPGRVPLQGEIIFNPALGMRVDAVEMTHAVRVSLECVRGVREYNASPFLWRGEAFQGQVAHGTQSLKFKIDLPDPLPAVMPRLSWAVQEQWLVELKTLGGEVRFPVPHGVVGETAPSVLQQTQSLPASAAKIAARVRWGGRAIQFLFIAVFLWMAIFKFAVPMYQSSQQESQQESQPIPQAMPRAVASPRPTVNAPFLLDSLSGNGFAVVARAAGRMEIGENAVLIYPDSIELRSFGTCAPNCPAISSVEFMLSKVGADYFSVLATSASIPAQQSLSDAGSLTVNVPADRLPLVLNFADRQQLAGLRLTLAINGATRARDGRMTEGSWYTHAYPFAASGR